MYANLQCVLLYKNMVIKSMILKVKNWFLFNEREIVLLGAFLLISAISFGLGILWQKDSGVKAPIAINKQFLASNVIGGELPVRVGEITVDHNSGADKVSGLIYVASKKGKYYHLPECVGAKAIKPENKIEFKFKEEAEKAGYKPAGNCPGLSQ